LRNITPLTLQFSFDLASSPIHPNFMMYITKQDTNEDELKRHIDEELDEALDETFPASDPVEPPLDSEHRRPGRPAQREGSAIIPFRHIVPNLLISLIQP
jgi:hypothetical protein